MAFTESWIETDPDGSIVTVSQVDDHIRLKARAVRERLEGDPAVLGSGVYESGTFGTTAMVKKGVARAFTITNADQTTTYLQDGRLAINLDTNVLSHSRASGLTPVKVSGADVNGPLRVADGTAGVPAYSFALDTDVGVYRGGTDELGLVAGAGVVKINASGQALLQNGTALLPVASFASDPDTGIYRAGDNEIGFATAGGRRWSITSAELTPGGDNVYDLGTTSARVRTIYTGSGMIADGAVVVRRASDDYAVSGRISGDAEPRVALMAGGTLRMGSGTGAHDVELSRSAAGEVAFSSKLRAPVTADAIPYSFVGKNSGIGLDASSNMKLWVEGQVALKLSATSALIADGTAAAPSLRFQSDDDTGFYRDVNNEVCIALGGLIQFRFTSKGILGDSGDTTRPAFSFISETGTGMWRQAAGEIAFSLSGAKKVDFSVGGNDTTCLVLAVKRGAVETVERILVGAADSGGVGFRALRIAN